MRLVSHPILCNYYVTYRCNAQCGFCDIWERPSPYVTREQVETNLKSLKKLGVKVIDFTGGEPLLHRDIDHFFAYAKKMGFITTLTTNGLLYPKYAEKLHHNVDMLHFSLDTADKTQHDTMRGVPCYDHVMESIQIAKSLGERPDILMTVFEDNIGEIEKLYTDICLPHDLVLILNPSFDYNEVETGTSLSEKSLQTLTRWGQKKNIYLNQAFIQLRRDGGNQTDSPVCKAASTTLVISPENELLLPCYHLGTKGFPIGSNLEEVYRSTEAQKLVALEGRLPECQGCAINCYMQPSFATNVNRYFWSALPSTIKYNWIKGTWKSLIP
ncbi:radical SAM protein [Reichenbachiella sp. 5M10]|uniref:radical SAM protein n=1 Tax=Reichenbachiella sp. 5M10 TaxID=1889772 RepID=UPI000C161DC5|nr:radical SAM protein [Reichenbachiella sp. 5M10]PIB36279.1 radical SAM protein [Reichenbachiella sp. 5M10]